MKKYEKYKDSGIEWIGEIPEHWQIVNFRYLINTLTDYTANGSFGDLAKNVDYLDEGYSRLIRLTDLRANFENKGIYLNEHSHNYLNKSELFGGEVLLANVGAYAGLAWVFKNFQGKASLGPNMFLLRFKNKLDNNFAYISLISDYLHNQLLNKATSSAQPKLNKEDVRSCYFILPSKEEQTTIASFLDHKTAQIDSLIEKKEQLIEKLKLQRQAIINEAVTKGLNPNVPMKDSGIEWLGEIPEHWDVIQMRHCFSFTKGLSITKEALSETGIPCVNYGEIHSKYGFEVNPEKDKLGCVTEDFLQTNENALLSKGDFVFADTSEDLEGSGNFTYLNSELPTFAGYHTIIARLKNSIHYRYFAYFFDSLAFRTQIRKQVKGVKVFSITNKILKGAFLFCPPEKEQKEISNYIDNKTSSLFKTIQKLELSIEKLKLYRQSLISEAVTGKIDVRGWENV
ncbi:restriction endonuclease subunit S [Thermophagus sp. OGC60D27]|uniref:restriction endonuclease subunit S n=1 Tax=Thermophagus sp. OGC60D27 TaxID=3458415 RepID=UPI004037DB68